MQQNNSNLDPLGVMILVVLCLSWGVQQVAIKVAIPGISPVLQAGIRSIGATILILVWMKIRHIAILDKDGTFWWGMTVGLLFSGEFLLIYWGLQFTNASRAVIFLYMSPFVVALGAQWFVPEEQLTKNQVVGLCLAFVGIIIAFHESLNLPTNRMLVGDSMLIGAAVLWGATTILIKASPLAAIAPSKTLLYQLAISAFVLPLGALIMGEPGFIKVSPLIAACIIYQIVWVAFITYLTWFWLIKRYSVSRVASFTFLTPLFGVIAGGLCLNEQFSINLLFSLVFVGTGIYLVNLPESVVEMKHELEK